MPDNITLVKLHRVIQEVMGWHEYHLHEFIIDHRHYGMVDPDDPFDDLGPELISEKRKKLEKLLGQKKYILIFSDLEEDLVEGHIRDFTILDRLDDWEKRVYEGGGITCFVCGKNLILPYVMKAVHEC